MFVADTYDNIVLSKIILHPLVQIQICKAALPHAVSEALSPFISIYIFLRCFLFSESFRMVLPHIHVLVKIRRKKRGKENCPLSF